MNIDRMLDKIRFESWLFAFNQLLEKSNGFEREKPNFDFHKIVETLEEMHHILEGSGEGNAGVQHQQLSLLRYQHTSLIEALPSYYRSIAKEHLVSQVLKSDDTEQLGGLSTAVTEADAENIDILLAVKHLTALSKTGRLTERSDLILDQNCITVKGHVDIHSLAMQEPTSELVLVEWLRYRASWADGVIGPELLRRLTSVVGLLHAESTAKIPGSLHCRGIFHDPSEPAFGVVYDLPLQGTQPVTLHGLLSAARSPYRPLLEYRFQLAFDICQCIYTFHKVGWLHRNLHSMNVLFFPPKGAKNAEWAKEPRILGFAGSRENQLDAVTLGPDDKTQLRNYQHPEYLAHKERYREEFDYYSVGMLLLEIGLWSPLSKITESGRFQGVSNEQFKNEVIRNRVPQLSIFMGTRYMEATRTCLEGGFVEKTGGSGDGKRGCYMSFKSLVID